MTIAIVVIIIGVFGSAFISASEAALISVNKVRMRRLAGEGDRRAIAAVKVTEEHEKFFGAILLTGNVLNIMITAVATSLAISIMDKNNGAVVSRGQIEKELAKAGLGGVGSVKQHIMRLRRKFEDNAKDPTWFANVPGVGYRFIGGPKNGAGKAI